MHAFSLDIMTWGLVLIGGSNLLTPHARPISFPFPAHGTMADPPSYDLPGETKHSAKIMLPFGNILQIYRISVMKRSIFRRTLRTLRSSFGTFALVA